MPLVTLGLIGIDAFFLSVAIHLGLRCFLGDYSALNAHILWSLFAIFFTCFIHCMAMFYLVGTGKDVQKAIAGHPDLQEKYAKRLRDFKWDVHPYATFASVFMIVVGALGAAVHTGHIPRWTHFAAVLVALVFNVVTFFKEYVTVHKNRVILVEVGKALYERGVRA